MSRYQFELAQSHDDAALRQVMAQTPMTGSVTLTFQREPSYFDSNHVLGSNRQAIVCRDNVRGEIVGLATRSVREQYVDGQIKPVGYLGALRSIEHARNRGQLARGYQFLRQLHDADPHAPDYYLTTIAEENQQAISLLTSGRAGLPTYHPLSRLHTLVIPTGRSRNSDQICAHNADCVSHPHEINELVRFLNAVGARKTFFPVYRTDDFGEPTGTFSRLDTSSITVVRRHGKIIAAAGVWDQRAFRQTIVSGYAWPLRLSRPLINLWARTAGGIVLPRVGTPLKACLTCFPIVAEDDPDLFDVLVRRLLQIAPFDADCLLLGLCDNDPLLSIARTFSRSEYTTRLYAVNWSTLPESVVAPNAKPYYLELGSL